MGKIITVENVVMSGFERLPHYDAKGNFYYITLKFYKNGSYITEIPQISVGTNGIVNRETIEIYKETLKKIVFSNKTSSHNVFDKAPVKIAICEGKVVGIGHIYSDNWVSFDMKLMPFDKLQESLYFEISQSINRRFLQFLDYCEKMKKLLNCQKEDIKISDEDFEKLTNALNDISSISYSLRKLS